MGRLCAARSSADSVNRREILIGSLCAALSAAARSSNRTAGQLPSDESLGDGCVVSTDGGSSALGQRTAVFVLGRCDVAISEITRLGLSIRTLAYFEGSTYGPNAEAGFADVWNVGRKRIRKVKNTYRLVEWVAENHDRVAILGNFSAPFASRMLDFIARKARRAGMPVFAIGAAPSAGAEGLVRTQRGLNCIANLRRLGCCVVTVPDVDFDLDESNETVACTESKTLQVNEGATYCRALELALKQVHISVVAFDIGQITSIQPVRTSH